VRHGMDEPDDRCREDSMKAVRIHDHGGPEVLRIEDAPLPVVRPDDARVRIVGASVNPVDWKIRQGHLVSMLSESGHARGKTVLYVGPP